MWPEHSLGCQEIKRDKKKETPLALREPTGRKQNLISLTTAFYVQLLRVDHVFFYFQYPNAEKVKPAQCKSRLIDQDLS